MTKLQSLVSFFEANIRNHNKVADCDRLLCCNDDEYIYEIQRKDDLRPIRVYLCDVYEYGSGDYAGRPKEIRAGDFILLNSFVPGVGDTVVEEARRGRIAIGPWRKLLGALNSPDVWRYRMPEERNERTR